MVIFVFVGAVTPGPVNILAISIAVNYGLRHAVMHVVGASVAYAMVVFISGSIMHSLLYVFPKLEFMMQVFGSVFLLNLAYKIFYAPIITMDSIHQSCSGFWMGLMIQVLNPKAWLVSMSGVSLFVVGQINERMALVVFTSVSLFICLIGVGVWVILGRTLTNILRNPTWQKRFNNMMSGLLGGCVLLIWL